MNKILFPSESPATLLSRWPAKFFILIILACLKIHTVLGAEAELSRLEASVDYIRQVDRYQDEISALEDELGPYDRSLIDPLGRLARLYNENNIFDSANSLLDRQLQLLHISEGPNTFSQIPILNSLIQNHLTMNNFNAVTNNFENILFVFSQNSDANIEQKFGAMEDLINWHYMAFNLDDKRNRINHFLKARALLRQMVTIAKDNYVERDPRMIPILYKVAIEKYNLSALLLSPDELGHDANDKIYRPEQTEPGTYLRQGYEVVKEIRAIVQLSGDKEAEGMAAVYEADFQMLLELGTAQRSYREAMQLFEIAGKSRDEIGDFFSRPVVLPVSEFYSTLDSAIVAQDGSGYRYVPGVDGSDPTVHLGNYRGWNESLLTASMPMPPALISEFEIEMTRADMVFRISSRGKTRNADAEVSIPDTVQAKVDSRKALEAMTFRPRFRGNRWRMLRGITMTYWYPPEK